MIRGATVTVLNLTVFTYVHKTAPGNIVPVPSACLAACWGLAG